MNGLIQKVEAGIRKQSFAQLMGFRAEEAEEGRVVISCERRADLLQQTEGTGIDIYTHGEMLPGHYYPQLRRHRHLVGHYGNAWWQQRQELEHFHGPIVFTTNCLVPPHPGAGYADKVFTLDGRCLGSAATIGTLPKGIYIVGNKKVVK